MKEMFFFAFLACLVTYSCQSEYKAVVVEYAPYTSTSKNVGKYADVVDAAAKRYSFDIIIFPEETLTMELGDACPVPHPDEKVTPYTNKSYENYPTIRTMSEMAARRRVYVVVNLFERLECRGSSDCPDRGYFLYNTNVAFDRNGTVVARYRKFNLYLKNVDKPKEAELSTFTTDFGVTFGMFICFDIVFKTPARDLVQQKNIKNIIFSTYWHGELPFLTGIQVQVGWSYAMNVTLYASGANLPQFGGTGSGIYRRGKKNSWMVEKDMDIIITEESSEVLREAREIRGLELKESQSVSLAAKKDLKPSRGEFKETLCYKNLCCRFNIKYRESDVRNDGNYSYSAVVFDDVRDFGMNETHAETFCGVILCSSGNCGKKPSSGNYPLIFDEINIEGDFERKDSFQMPTTLVWTGDKTKISLFDTLNYDYFSFVKGSVEKKTDSIKMNLKKAGVDKLITFAVYGRKFD